MVIRKKGLGFLLIVAAAIAVLSLLINDILIDRLLESTGSAVTGARVEFDGVDFSLFRLRLRWQKLQAANPVNTGRNLIETGYSELGLAVEPLFLKRYVVENMRMDSMRFDTKRKTSGALPGGSARSVTIVERIQKALLPQIMTLPGFNVNMFTELNTDSLLRLAGIQTPGMTDSLLEAARARLQIWRGSMDRLPVQPDRLRNIREDIESITIDTAMTADRLSDILLKITRIHRRMDSLRLSIDSFQTNLAEDIQSLREYPELITEWILDDFGRIRKLIDFPDISSSIITRALFGPIIINKVQTILTYIGIARYYGEKAKIFLPEKEPKPPRLHGQTIRYTSARDWPGLWIKHTAASAGIVQSISLSGTILNVATQQKLTGRPTKISLEGTRPGGPSARLTGTLDYLEDIPREMIALNAQRIPINDFTLSESFFLPVKLTRGIADIDGELMMNGDQFTFSGGFHGTGLVVQLAESISSERNELTTLFESIIRSINQISIQTSMSWKQEKLNFSVSSNMGDLVADFLTQYIATQIGEVRRKTSEYIMERTEDSRDALDQLIEKESGELQSTLNVLNGQIAEILTLVDAKKNALENRFNTLGAETREKIRKEVEEKLRNLF